MKKMTIMNEMKEIMNLEKVFFYIQTNLFINSKKYSFFEEVECLHIAESV